MSIVKALAAAQAEFKPIEKSRDNPHFKSKFADIADVLQAVRPVLARHGISVTMPFGEDGRLRCVLLHESGTLESVWPISVPANLDSQKVGAWLTYAKRQLLCAMVGVHPGGEDDDGNEAVAEEAKAATLTKAKARPVYDALQRDLRACQSAAAVHAWAKDRKPDLDSLPADWVSELRAEYRSALMDHERREQQTREAAAFEAEQMMARRDG